MVVLSTIDLDNFSMYPNPAIDKVALNLKEFAGRKVDIHLVNGYGQILKSLELGAVTNTRATLSVEDIPSGFYQVIVKPEGHKGLARKLIIEKID